MTAGFLGRAMEQAFGDTEPDCDFCEDTRRVRMLGVNGDPMDIEVPCPLCPLLVVPIAWYRDTLTTGGAA